jgi:dCTP deaminase
MILSGKEILNKLGKDIFIDPFNEAQLNPNSYNLKLHNELLVYKDTTLDMKKANATETILIPDEGLLLEPGRLYLGRTVEHCQTENHAPLLDGRSSIGRLGISIHITAGLGHVGSRGYWTLEIACVQPIVIYPFVEICQVYFFEINGEHNRYTSSKYSDNKGIQPSLLYKEFER